MTFIIYKMTLSLQLKFSQVPVCRADISVKQHIPCKDQKINKTDLLSDKQISFQNLVFKIRRKVCVFADHRINQADPRQRVSCRGRILKAKGNINGRPPGAKTPQQSADLPQQTGKRLLMGFIRKEPRNILLFMIQCLYLIT